MSERSGIVEVHAVQEEPILLGRQGEHLARRILFDISEWEAVFGPGTVRLLHQRQGDPYPYPAAVTQEPGRVLWDVKAWDTRYPCQYGKAELRYYVPLDESTGNGGDSERDQDAAEEESVSNGSEPTEKLVKSDVYQTSVLPALGPPTEEVPEAGMDWIASLLDAVGQA